jgi:hypothetical protein
MIKYYHRTIQDLCATYKSLSRVSCWNYLNSSIVISPHEVFLLCPDLYYASQLNVFVCHWSMVLKLKKCGADF